MFGVDACIIVELRTGTLFQRLGFQDGYVEAVGVLDSIVNIRAVARRSCAFSFGMPLQLIALGGTQHQTALRVEMNIIVST